MQLAAPLNPGKGFGRPVWNVIRDGCVGELCSMPHSFRSSIGANVDEYTDAAITVTRIYSRCQRRPVQIVRGPKLHAGLPNSESSMLQRYPALPRIAPPSRGSGSASLSGGHVAGGAGSRRTVPVSPTTPGTSGGKW